MVHVNLLHLFRFPMSLEIGLPLELVVAAGAQDLIHLFAEPALVLSSSWLILSLSFHQDPHLLPLHTWSLPVCLHVVAAPRLTPRKPHVDVDQALPHP